ncbi:MAG: alpha/beta hydrolase [Mangrovibacterium sp.]
MKTNHLFYFLLMVLLSVACQEEEDFDSEFSTGITTKSAIIIPEGMTEGTLITTEFFSPSLEGNLLGDPAVRQVNIYLPKSYFSCPGKRFPVIYFLHGFPAWESMLTEPAPFEIFRNMAQLAMSVDFPEDGFVNWINDLVTNGEMKESIIVMPDARTMIGPSLYLNSEVVGNYDDYITNDLVNFVDQNLRTIPHFNWRAITGHCAGAYGALNIAMRHPHVFHYVGALSPAHFTDQHLLAMAQYSAYEDQVWSEMGIPPGPTAYDPMAPFKFATNSLYMLSQAWLPNPDNPPCYCDLPYAVIDGQIVLDPERMGKVDAQNLLAQTRRNETGLRQLKTVYFDCGANDELFMFPFNQLLDKQLTEMHIKHQFEVHDGTHISRLYERLEKMWGELSNDFPEYDD